MSPATRVLHSPEALLRDPLHQVSRPWLGPAFPPRPAPARSSLGRRTPPLLFEREQAEPTRSRCGQSPRSGSNGAAPTLGPLRADPSPAEAPASACPEALSLRVSLSSRPLPSERPRGRGLSGTPSPLFSAGRAEAPHQAAPAPWALSPHPGSPPIVCVLGDPGAQVARPGGGRGGGGGPPPRRWGCGSGTEPIGTLTDLLQGHEFGRRGGPSLSDLTDRRWPTDHPLATAAPRASLGRLQTRQQARG